MICLVFSLPANKDQEIEVRIISEEKKLRVCVWGGGGGLHGRTRFFFLTIAKYTAI